MRLIHHVSENIIINQWYSQKYNNNENIDVNKQYEIITLEVLLINGITINNED